MLNRSGIIQLNRLFKETVTASDFIQEFRMQTTYNTEGDHIGSKIVKESCMKELTKRYTLFYMLSQLVGFINIMFGLTFTDKAAITIIINPPGFFMPH